MNKVWVHCTHCDTKYSGKLFSSRPNYKGKNCLICGSNWIYNDIIASTEITEVKPPGVIIWLV